LKNIAGILFQWTQECAVWQKAGAMKTSILGLTLGEVQEALKALGHPAYRAKQIFEWLYRRKALAFSAMSNLPAELRDQLAEAFSIAQAVVQVFTSEDGTKKFRFEVGEKEFIEAVWMPDEKRNTLCISSQVGCPMKCAFCVTGAVGYKRNLTVDEIVAQVRHVKVLEDLPVSNVVFMGMGEPLLNAKCVTQAIAVMTDHEGLGIGKRKITVSTVGLVPEILPFWKATDVKLAVSLTGSTEAERDYWMPINKKYDLETLTAELRKIPLHEGRKITFEVVLIKDRTDSLEQALALVHALKGIPSKVNLIQYNENPFFPDLKAPSRERVEAFRDRLIKSGIHAMVRKNRGRDIMAACGQLAGKA
jgi:23S rRNA (adenine2503-C2)-methyltransferase